MTFLHYLEHMVKTQMLQSEGLINSYAIGAFQNPHEGTHTPKTIKKPQRTQSCNAVSVMITKYIREDLSDPCHPCSDTENDIEHRFNGWHGFTRI